MELKSLLAIYTCCCFLRNCEPTPFTFQIFFFQATSYRQIGSVPPQEFHVGMELYQEMFAQDAITTSQSPLTGLGPIHTSYRFHSRLHFRTKKIFSIAKRPIAFLQSTWQRSTSCQVAIRIAATLKVPLQCQQNDHLVYYLSTFCTRQAFYQITFKCFRTQHMKLKAALCCSEVA